MSVTLISQPKSIALLRLSALGDVTHVLPLVHTLQRHIPEAKLYWIIDTSGYRLLEGLPEVHFYTYDKRSGLAGMHQLRKQVQREHGEFDILLHMQLSLRANILAGCIPARRRVGFHVRNAKEGHRFVVKEHIPYSGRVHVLDTFGYFAQPLGFMQDSVSWGLPVPADAVAWAETQWPKDQRPTMIISPCSSHAHRNWYAERYAAVADHVVQRGWRVVLCAGRSALEQQMCAHIVAQAQASLVDLSGKDTLKQLAALLARADIVLTPDAGPMHIANAVGTSVLGLHAASNPLRSGPYSDIRYCVDRYDDAARRFLKRSATQLPWGTKIERQGVMDLITVEDTIAAFERYISTHPQNGANVVVNT